jgi:hypothetical protein
VKLQAGKAKVYVAASGAPSPSLSSESLTSAQPRGSSQTASSAWSPSSATA